MTYEELVEIAHQNFRDDQDFCVADCFADRESYDSDLLAEYVVEDLDGVAGFDNDDVDELREAAYRMDQSAKVLAAVADGFRVEGLQREDARRKSQQ